MSMISESVRNPEPKFYNNHETAWSFGDMDELRLHFETGGTVEGAATLLSRTLDEVQQKATELQLIK